MKYFPPVFVCIFWVPGVLLPAWCDVEGLPSGAPPESPGVVLPDTAPQPAPSIALELAAEEKPRKMTESESRQFVVHGSDFTTRSAIASLAERTRTTLLEIMGKDGDGWEHAVAIQLRDGNAPVKMSFGGGNKLRAGNKGATRGGARLNAAAARAPASSIFGADEDDEP